MSKRSVLVSLFVTLLTPMLASAEMKRGPAPASSQAKAVYADIEKTLGVVPTFLKEFPAEAIGAAWDEMKAVPLNPNTALNMATKELIGLAVAAQIPCRYCTYFHKEVAMLGGASERQVKEAVVLAALTRKWSTVLHGSSLDAGMARSETMRIVAHFKKPRMNAKPIMVTDAASAFMDIEATLGLVPSYFRAIPEASVAPAWLELKTLGLGDTSLPGKSKQLIGLAVASQIPSDPCVMFYTETAKLMGATDVEIRETIAIAALTRKWSTVLNGLMLDEAQFRKEVNQALAHVRKMAAAAAKR